MNAESAHERLELQKRRRSQNQIQISQDKLNDGTAGSKNVHDEIKKYLAQEFFMLL